MRLLQHSQWVSFNLEHGAIFAWWRWHCSWLFESQHLSVHQGSGLCNCKTGMHLILSPQTTLYPTKSAHTSLLLYSVSRNSIYWATWHLSLVMSLPNTSLYTEEIHKDFDLLQHWIKPEYAILNNCSHFVSPSTVCETSNIMSQYFSIFSINQTSLNMKN